MMSKKNYELAAQIVRRLAHAPGPSSIAAPSDIRRRKENARVAAVAFALFFRDDNPKFDQEKFLAASGVEIV